MARNQEPVSEDELKALREEMNEQREDIREALAEDLGGEPEDYDAEACLNDRAGESVADGDESACFRRCTRPIPWTQQPALRPGAQPASAGTRRLRRLSAAFVSSVFLIRISLETDGWTPDGLISTHWVKQLPGDHDVGHSGGSRESVARTRYSCRSVFATSQFAALMCAVCPFGM